MNRNPALVTAAALTMATSAAVSGLFLTIGNSATAAAEPATETITEYVVAEAAAQQAAPVEVIAQPVDGDDPFANFGEYFEHEDELEDHDEDKNEDERDRKNERENDEDRSGKSDRSDDDD